MRSYIDQKSTLQSQNWQFSHFYVNQLFSADARMDRNSNFVFVFAHKNVEKKPPSKVGYFSKMAALPWRPKKSKSANSFELL